MKVKRRTQVLADASVSTDGETLSISVTQSSKTGKCSTVTKTKDSQIQSSVETCCAAAETDKTSLRSFCMQTSRPQTAVVQKQILEKKVQVLEDDCRKREKEKELLKHQVEEYERRQSGIEEEMETVNQNYATTSARIALLQWQLSVVSDTLIAEEKECLQRVYQLRDKYTSFRDPTLDRVAEKEDDLVSVQNMQVQTDACDEVDGAQADATFADDQDDEECYNREDTQQLPASGGAGDEALRPTISGTASGDPLKNVTTRETLENQKSSTCTVL